MKKRVLFVDDNLILRQACSLMLKVDGGEWDVSTAGSGEEALALMERESFDVVLSDLRMPGMDGLELIGQVRRRFPHMARVMISAVDDQEEVARCLGDTHQFLAKPFDGATLRKTLSTLCGLDAHLKDEKLRSLVARLGKLPSFPALYTSVMKELAEEQPSIENISRAISRDPGMTAKMLQVVNSAAFGLAQQISSPFQAVLYLGLGMVRSLVISGHVFDSVKHTSLRSFSTNRLWDHSMKTASLAGAILRTAGGEAEAAEAAYTAGMLHDIGKLLLAGNAPDEYGRAIDFADAHKLPLHEAEQQILGATHAGVGAYLLGLWGLPADIVEAVAFHHTPLVSVSRDFGPLTATHVANLLQQGTSSSKKDVEEGEPAMPDLDYLNEVGVLDKLDEWRELARSQAIRPFD